MASTRPVLGRWRTYADPYVCTHLAPLSKPNNLSRPLTRPEMGRRQTYADSHVPKYLTLFFGVDVLDGFSHNVWTGEYLGLCALCPNQMSKIKHRTVSFSKSYLLLEYNTKETCKNNNHNDKNNTKTNINKKYSENI